MAMYTNSPLSSPLRFLLRSPSWCGILTPRSPLRTSRIMTKRKKETEKKTTSSTPPHPTAPPPPSSRPASPPSLFPPTPRPRWPLHPPPLPPVSLMFCLRLCSRENLGPPGCTADRRAVPRCWFCAAPGWVWGTCGSLLRRCSIASFAGFPIRDSV